MSKEQQKEIISQFSPNLFWDVDMSQMDLSMRNMSSSASWSTATCVTGA